jgi:DNA primase
MGTGLEVRVVILDDGVDPCDLLLQEQGKQRFEGLLESGVDPIEFIVKQIQGRHPGQGASAAQQMMEEISRVVLDPYHDQQVALEAAAGQVARVIGVTEPMILADHTRLRQLRSPSRMAPANSESTQKSRLPDEEEAILVAMMGDPDQAELLLKLRPVELWSDPLRRSLAIRIGQLGRKLDPVHIEDDDEKSLYLDLDARVDREKEITADDDRESVRYNTSLDLVRAFLTDMNGRSGTGKKDSQRTIDINKAIQSMDLDRESHQNPSLLLQIINKFEGGKKSDAPAR